MLRRPRAARERSATTTLAQRWMLALASLASFMVILDMLVVAQGTDSDPARPGRLPG
jgi:hypothetical protein